MSYSHLDRDIVEPVVGLLRITRNDVFWDFASIPLGELWRDRVLVALNEADVIVVFWCAHANESTEVQAEWQAGIHLKKRLLPVILDETVMPEALGRFQGIDFRGLTRSRHGQRKRKPDNLHAIALPAVLLLMAIGPIFAGRWWLYGVLWVLIIVVGLGINRILENRGQRRLQHMADLLAKNI